MGFTVLIRLVDAGPVGVGVTASQVFSRLVADQLPGAARRRRAGRDRQSDVVGSVDVSVLAGWVVLHVESDGSTFLQRPEAVHLELGEVDEHL
jgi:hypothetical protein